MDALIGIIILCLLFKFSGTFLKSVIGCLFWVLMIMIFIAIIVAAGKAWLYLAFSAICIVIVILCVHFTS